jgi:hypothetical protein
MNHLNLRTLTRGLPPHERAARTARQRLRPATPAKPAPATHIQPQWQPGWSSSPAQPLL